jgi:hypothetical protein
MSRPKILVEGFETCPFCGRELELSYVNDKGTVTLVCTPRCGTAIMSRSGQLLDAVWPRLRNCRCVTIK